MYIYICIYIYRYHKTHAGSAQTTSITNLSAQLLMVEVGAWEAAAVLRAQTWGTCTQHALM